MLNARYGDTYRAVVRIYRSDQISFVAVTANQQKFNLISGHGAFSKKFIFKLKLQSVYDTPRSNDGLAESERRGSEGVVRGGWQPLRSPSRGRPLCVRNETCTFM